MIRFFFLLLPLLVWNTSRCNANTVERWNLDYSSISSNDMPKSWFTMSECVCLCTINVPLQEFANFVLPSFPNIFQHRQSFDGKSRLYAWYITDNRVSTVHRRILLRISILMWSRSCDSFSVYSTCTNAAWHVGMLIIQFKMSTTSYEYKIFYLVSFIRCNLNLWHALMYHPIFKYYNFVYFIFDGTDWVSEVSFSCAHYDDISTVEIAKKKCILKPLASQPAICAPSSMRWDTNAACITYEEW